MLVQTSVFVTSAVSNILSSMKISLPALTLPFNIVVILLFLCLMPQANLPNGENGPVASFRMQNSAGAVDTFTHDNQFPTAGHEKDESGVNVIKSISRQIRKAEDQDNVPTLPIPEINGEDQNDNEQMLNWGKVIFL